MLAESYESFDVLKDSILEDVNGTRLIVEKEGESSEFYINSFSNVLYLSKQPAETTKALFSINEPPLVGFINREIDLVQKDFWSLQDRIYDTPKRVILGVKTLPFRYELFGNDNNIFVTKTPSIRYRIARLSEILNFPESLTSEQINSLTPDDIRELKAIERFFKPLPVFDEEALKEHYPTLHDMLRSRI